MLEIHKPIPSSTTGVIVVLVDLYGLVSNSCKCLVICNEDVSTSNSNPGLVMTLGVNFWNIMFPKSGPDKTSPASWHRWILPQVHSVPGCQTRDYSHPLLTGPG